MKGWKQNILWNIEKHIPQKYIIVLTIMIIILGTILSYKFLYSSNSNFQIAYLLEFEGKEALKIDTLTGKIIDTIETGATLGGIAISSDGKNLYVTRIGNKVAIINTETKKETTSIIVKDDPVYLILSPKGNLLFALNRKGNSVSVIDTSSQMIISHISVGEEPISAAISSDGTELYVCNYSSANISVIDIEKNIVTKTIPVEGRPVAIASAINKLYIANSSSETIQIIDAKEKIISTNIHTSGASRDITASPDGKFIYAVIPDTKSILIIDAINNKIIGELVIKENITYISTSPDGKNLYISSPSTGDNEFNKILIYDLEKRLPSGYISLKYPGLKIIFSDAKRQEYKR